VNPALPSKLHSVLFICTMNAVRSPIAEGMARLRFGKRLFVDSAGLTKSDRDGFALAVLCEMGLAFEDDEPHTLDEVECDSFDLIVALSPEAYRLAGERLRASAVELLYWPIEDATQISGTRDQRLDAFRRVRDTLDKLIRDELGPRVG
jgi:protein-tyrosine-phosphatase